MKQAQQIHLEETHQEMHNYIFSDALILRKRFINLVHKTFLRNMIHHKSKQLGSCPNYQVENETIIEGEKSCICGGHRNN